MRADEIIIVDRETGQGLSVNSYNGQASVPVVAGTKEVFNVTKAITSTDSSTPYILIDLSNDGGEWPHPAGASRVDIHWIDMLINPESGFRGNIRVGGITEISSDAALSPTIFDYQFNRRDEMIVHTLNYPAGGILRGDFENWFGPSSTSDTNYMLGTDISGPDDSDYEPGSGDIVLDSLITADGTDITVSIGYTVS